MSTYKANHPEYKKTLCDLLSERGTMKTIESALDYNSEIIINDHCELQNNTNMFLINIIIGAVQFAAFASTSKISYYLGKRATIGKITLLF